MCKKTKKRKSQRKGFKVKSMYSVRKMTNDTEAYSHLEGEVRQAFIESLNDYYLKWSAQQHAKGLINQNAVEIADQVDYYQRKGNELKIEASKSFGNEKFRKSKIKESEEFFRKARFMLDFSVFGIKHKDGTAHTHKDYVADGQWDNK